MPIIANVSKESQNAALMHAKDKTEYNLSPDMSPAFTLTGSTDYRPSDREKNLSRERQLSAERDQRLREQRLADAKDKVVTATRDAKERLEEDSKGIKETVADTVSGVKQYFVDAKDTISERLGSAKDAAADKIHAAEDKAADARDAMSDKVASARDAVRDAARDAKSQIKEEAHSISDRVRSTSADARDMVRDKFNHATEHAAETVDRAREEAREEARRVGAAASNTREALRAAAHDPRAALREAESPARESSQFVDGVRDVTSFLRRSPHELANDPRRLQEGVSKDAQRDLNATKDSIRERTLEAARAGKGTIEQAARGAATGMEEVDMRQRLFEEKLKNDFKKMTGKESVSSAGVASATPKDSTTGSSTLPPSKRITSEKTSATESLSSEPIPPTVTSAADKEWVKQQAKAFSPWRTWKEGSRFDHLDDDWNSLKQIKLEMQAIAENERAEEERIRDEAEGRGLWSRSSDRDSQSRTRSSSRDQQRSRSLDKNKVADESEESTGTLASIGSRLASWWRGDKDKSSSEKEAEAFTRGREGRPATRRNVPSLDDSDMKRSSSDRLRDANGTFTPMDANFPEARDARERSKEYESDRRIESLEYDEDYAGRSRPSFSPMGTADAFTRERSRSRDLDRLDRRDPYDMSGRYRSEDSHEHLAEPSPDLSDMSDTLAQAGAVAFNDRKTVSLARRSNPSSTMA